MSWHEGLGHYGAGLYREVGFGVLNDPNTDSLINTVRLAISRKLALMKRVPINSTHHCLTNNFTNKNNQP